MKKIILMSLVLIFAVSLSANAKPKTSGSSNGESFENSYLWKKLDSNMQKAWLNAKKSGDMSVRLNCFVRFQGSANMGDRDFLVSNGFWVLGMSNLMASGYVSAENLPRIAGQGFVSKINLIIKHKTKK